MNSPSLLSSLRPVAIGFLLCGVAALADDAKDLSGTWKPSSAELGGKPMPAAILQGITLRIDGTNYHVTVRLPDGKESPDKGTLVLDSKASPKGMIVRGIEGPNTGKNLPAIYELKADTLRICYDLSGAARPTEFKSTPGTRLYLVEYGRQK